MYPAKLYMTNADGSVVLTKEVELHEPPRLGARLRGHFANALLEVTRVVLDGSGRYEVFVGVSVLDLVPVHRLESYYVKSGWSFVDVFDEGTEVDLTPPVQRLSIGDS